MWTQWIQHERHTHLHSVTPRLNPRFHPQASHHFTSFSKGVLSAPSSPGSSNTCLQNSTHSLPASTLLGLKNFSVPDNYIWMAFLLSPITELTIPPPQGKHGFWSWYLLSHQENGSLHSHTRAEGLEKKSWSYMNLGLHLLLPWNVSKQIHHLIIGTLSFPKPLLISSFIHPIFSIYCVPGTILRTWHKTVNRRDNISCSSEVDVSMGGVGAQKINCKYNGQVKHIFQEVIWAIRIRKVEKEVEWRVCVLELNRVAGWISPRG